MSYTVRLKNNGPQDSLATILEIRLPANSRLISEITGCTRAPSSRNVSCNIGTMPTGAEKLYQVRVEPTASGTIVLRGDVQSNSPDATTNDRSVSRQLQVSDVPRPPNDNLAFAQTVTGEHATVNGSNVNGTIERANDTISSLGEIAHARQAAGKSVWYLWQAPTRPGTVKISTAGSTFDTLLDVYEFTSAPLPIVAYNDDERPPVTSAVSFRYKPDTLYYIAVDGYNGASGDITLKIDVTLFLILSNRVDQRVTGFSPPTACSSVSNLNDLFCRPEREPGTGILLLTIKGENFVNGRSKVLVDGKAPVGTDLNGNPFTTETHFESSTELRVRVPPNPPLLFARVATAGVVTDVDINTTDPARPEQTVKAVAGQIGHIKIIDLKNATLAPGETRRICGAVSTSDPTVETCMNFVNTENRTVTVSPTWFAANAYCDQVERQFDRSLQCASTLTDGGAWTVNPPPGGIAGPVTFSLTTPAPYGIAQPAGIAPRFLVGGTGAYMIGDAGSTLIGNDGGTMIGDAGSTLIGNDGSTLISDNGAALIGNDGSTLISDNGAALIGLDGGSVISDAGAGRPEAATGQTPARPPLPLSPGDLASKTSGYAVVKGSGGSQPTVTYTADEVTQKAYITVSITLDETSTPKASNIGNMVFTMGLNPGVLKLQSNAVTVNENVGFAAVTVVRSGDTSGPASFEYTTHQEALVTTCSPAAATAGKASEKCDFATTLGAIRFAAGETAKEIRIPIVDDTFAEGTETFKLIIGNALGAAVEMPSSATITITDNDTATGPENPLDTTNAQFFVRQQYLDLLGREPSATELTAGTGPIAQCGADAVCRKTKSVDLSNAVFVQSQQASAYVFRLYRAAFGNTQPFPIPDMSNPTEAKKWPGYSAVSRELPLLTDGQTLAQKQLELASSFIRRKAFCEKYSLKTLTTGPTFVDAVLATIRNDTGVDLVSQRTALITAYDQAADMLAGRGAVMYRLSASSQSNPVNNLPFVNAEDSRGFASMLYTGYLKRDGDFVGLNALVTQLQSVSDRKVFIDQFVNGAEYRLRFGPAASNSSVTISGRVLTSTGQALRNAPVTLISPEGGRQTATTSSFGLFSFANVPNGATYTITVASKRYRFAARIVQVNTNLAIGDIVGLE